MADTPKLSGLTIGEVADLAKAARSTVSEPATRILDVDAPTEALSPIAQFAAVARRPRQLSPHFSLAEFACKCGRWPGCTSARPHPDLIGVLEAIRAFVIERGMKYQGQPVRGLRIVSGVRCPAHNQGVGGARSSQHVVGKAADILELVTPAQAFRLGARGVGVQERSGLVSHVDVRANKTQWTYPAGVRG